MRRTLAALAAGLLLGGASAQADDMYRMPQPLSATGGGVPAATTITPTYGTNTVTFSWYGMRGWSTIQASSDFVTWTNFASTMATAHAWSVTVTNPGGGSLYFRLLQSNGYAGSDQCSSCHAGNYNSEINTPHGSALSLLSAIHQDNNPSCLPCHTVGYGQPTGYTNATLTPTLANVGCENCHGPAGWHKSGDHANLHPALSLDPAICGSCHQGVHHPTYEEYSTTLHDQVNDDVKYGFNTGVYFTNTININGTNVYGYYVTTNGDLTLKTNITTGIVNSLNGPQTNKALWYVNSVYDPGQDRQVGCGMCHSGATRLAMLNDYEARKNGVVAPLSLPSGNDSGAWGATCATCHDPHQVNTFTNVVFGPISGSTNAALNALYGTNAFWLTPTNGWVNVVTQQLRNPTWSAKYYTMPTTADKRLSFVTNYDGSITTNYVFYGTTFANNYDPSVNVCGQCHNTRGARWDGRGYGLFTNYVPVSVTNIVATTVYTNFTTYINPWSGLTVTNTNWVNINVITTNVVAATNLVVTNGLTFTTNGYSRPPHLSAQYNMLIGIVQPDYLNTNAAGVATNVNATHSGFLRKSMPGVTTNYSAFNTNQCVQCHMPSYANTDGTLTTGHTFELDEHGCMICHTSGRTYQVTQAQTQAKLVNLSALLNYWAQDQGPSLLGTSAYGINGWEFTMAGNLAWTNAGVNGAGPSSSQQLKLPATVRQARFDAYMIYSDGSMGIHNPTYRDMLFNDAEYKLLSFYPIAAFKVKGNPYVGYNVAGTNVVFTNCFAGATNFAWDFGDTHTTNTTVGVVTNKYANAGVYTVVLTATANGTNQTLARTNYITVAVPPSVSFTNSAPAQTNTVVNFDGSASTGVLNYQWTFVTTNGVTTNTVYNFGPTVGYIFTNAGTFKVTLTGAGLGGSATATNWITITN